MDGLADIVDNVAASRFELERDGHLAELVYQVDGDRLVLVHTGVSEELGGQGLGGRLVEAAVERARRDGLTVVPVCPFARRWLRRNPDARSGVEIDVDGGGP